MTIKTFSDLLPTKKLTFCLAGLATFPAAISQFIRLASKNPETRKAFLHAFGWTAVISGGVIVGLWYGKKHSDAKAAKKTRLAEADAYTIERQADAMLYKAKAEADIARHKAMGKWITSNVSEHVVDSDGFVNGEDHMSWLENFSYKYTLPELPPFIAKIMAGVPSGYEGAMLLHLLSMLNALCFSKIRAKYLDGNVHAPNLQVIIEAAWGTGKAKFEDLFKRIFARVIETDNSKVTSLSDDDDIMGTNIIQVSGIGTSMPRFIDILAGNQGCHFYLFNSEVRALSIDMKKGNGLNFDFLRKAFENGDICRNNRSKEGTNGTFPIFMNYTITGTPNDIEFSFKKELEGGTLSRIAWATIPKSGRIPASLTLPEGDELEDIRNEVDAWRKAYCYTGNAGNNHSVSEYSLDLEYVCTALHHWILEQYDIAEAEGNPARESARMRMAAIAFHCAMALHMLWGEPTDAVTRQKVVDLTIYIANYCAERFLHKFGAQQNMLHERNQESESVRNPSTTTSNTFTEAHHVLSKDEEEAQALKALYDQGKGQKAIATAFYGSSDDKYVKRVTRRLETFYPGQIVWNRSAENTKF